MNPRRSQLQSATRGSDQSASTLRIEQMNMSSRQAQRDALAGLNLRALTRRHAPRVAAYFPVQMRLGASRFDHLDFHDCVGRLRDRLDVFGPHAQRDSRAHVRRQRRAFEHDLATVREVSAQVPASDPLRCLRRNSSTASQESSRRKDSTDGHRVRADARSVRSAPRSSRRCGRPSSWLRSDRA